MAKDLVCGMDVDEKVAEKKGLVSKDKTHYFCSESCKEKFEIKVPWYRSEGFGKMFPYVLGVVLIGGSVWSILGGFMTLYMGIFFVLFSLAKMPDWKGFVTAFSMYDLIAKRVKVYGWLYPGIEFLIGILYLFGVFITGAAWITLFIMSIGSIGVARNIFSKNQVKCACLGTKINVPLAKVTLLEDLIMVVMAIMILFGFGV